MHIENQQNHNPDIDSFAHRCGLHPLVAVMMFALDFMLFTTFEAPSMELLWLVSAFFGCAAILPCALIQKHAYGDSTGAAWGKAMAVGLLTACPTPLPAFLTAGWGIVGVAGMVERARLRKAANASVHNTDNGQGN